VLAGQQERSAPVKKQSEFDSEMGSRLPMTILLAEDNATNQKLALRLLDRLGYSADVAETGLQALEESVSGDYDLVLMDLQMPEMDGLEATRQIRRQLGAPKRPYIVAMTANAMAGDRERCLAAGMNDYVSKPIRVQALIDALARGAEVVHGTAAGGGDEAKEGGGSTNGASAEGGAVTASAQGEASFAAALDQAALDNLRNTVGGDEEFLAELVMTFLEDAPQLLADMRSAAEAGDAPGLRLSSHSLKSNSADFGAMDLNALCKQLEMMGKEEKLEGALALIDQADAAFAAVKPALLALAD